MHGPELETVITFFRLKMSSRQDHSIDSLHPPSLCLHHLWLKAKSITSVYHFTQYSRFSITLEHTLISSLSSSLSVSLSLSLSCCVCNLHNTETALPSNSLTFFSFQFVNVSCENLRNPAVKVQTSTAAKDVHASAGLTVLCWNLCGLIARSRHAKISLHFSPHPPGSQYLPTKQTLIPLLHWNTRCNLSAQKMRWGWWSGTYQSGPWWPPQGRRRRAGSSGTPGPGARKGLRREREVVHLFFRYWWFQKTVCVAQSLETGARRGYTCTLDRQMGSCASLFFNSCLSIWMRLQWLHAWGR